MRIRFNNKERTYKKLFELGGQLSTAVRDVQVSNQQNEL
jgi:hypothetical protein